MGMAGQNERGVNPAMAKTSSSVKRRPAVQAEPFRAQRELYRETRRALERARAAEDVSLIPLTSPSECHQFERKMSGHLRTLRSMA